MSNFEKQGITDADLPKVIIDLNRTPDLITLHTCLGIRFYEKNRILLFRTTSNPLSKGSCWEALFTDSTTKKLTNRVTAEKLISHLPHNSFIKINQSCILNRAFLLGISYKTRDCELFPPYDKIILTTSRVQFMRIKALLLK